MTTSISITKHPSNCHKCTICQCPCCKNKSTTCSCQKQSFLSSSSPSPSSNLHQSHSLLILLRHGTSDDELRKHFSGWNDCDLSLVGQQQMHHAGQFLRQTNFSIDVCFTSLLKRAVKSLFIIQQDMDNLWIPSYNMWRLNDRMLGNLTGFHQERAQALFGQNQIKQWLTHAYLAPLPLPYSDSRHPRFAHMHRQYHSSSASSSLPSSTETLIDVHKRLQPFFHDQLFDHLYQAHNILVVTHEDIIKTIVRLIHNFTPDQYHDHEIPIGIPIVFKFSLDTKIFYDGYYLSSTSFENTSNPQFHLFPTGFEQIKDNTKIAHYYTSVL